jgi:hypothetical protein
MNHPRPIKEIVADLARAQQHKREIEQRITELAAEARGAVAAEEAEFNAPSQPNNRRNGED